MRRLAACRGGATAIEYGLLVALIGLVLAGVMTQLGGGANGLFVGVKDALS